ncbi:MAG: hypothetical protein IPG82_02945 [Saprospiraceae bacterium]|nr:hypothetical protein [Saprospiraceae bacterium]
MMRYLLILLLSQSIVKAICQQNIQLKITVEVAAALRNDFQKDGRLTFHITQLNNREPRNRSEIAIGITPEHWDPSKSFVIDTRHKNSLAIGLEDLSAHLSEKYYYQVTYKQNLDDANENAVGNLYSDVDSFSLIYGASLHLQLNNQISPAVIVDHPFVQTVEIQSQYLSAFFGKPKYLKATMLLPSGYFNDTTKSYPICYRVPGLNGKYSAINGMINDENFSKWWFTKEAPQVIYVFLDSKGPYGDTYQLNSANNGPCGTALTEELIPAIEKLVRYHPQSNRRYLAGKSTGGWVALALQIFYPDLFDGTWSYSPDPVDFEHFGLIDIYHDSTIFYNKYGYLQPGKRTIYGEPTYSMKDWIARENVFSSTNDYRISGGQFGAYNAVFGPRGKDDLPSLLFDPLTGKIDHQIALQWENFDLKKILEKNWATLGPKLQGKIWIWTGDMDGLYSNVATRFLQKFLEKTEHPASDATISFTPMAGHTQAWDDKAVLNMIADKARKTP